MAVCQFWERKLQSFRDAFTQYRVALPDALDTNTVRVEDVRCADVVEDCRAWLEPVESSLAKNVLFRRQHKQLINGYVEYLNVLKFNANNRFASAHSVSDFHDISFSEQKDVEGGYQRGNDAARFTSTICGVLPADKIIAFERLLFRVSRGNAFSHFYEIPHPIEDPATDEKVKKFVFAVTFMGEQLARRISRIIGHNNGTEYPIPSTPMEITRLEQDIQSKLGDAASVLARTDAEIKELLQSLAVDPASSGHPDQPVSSPFLNWQQSLQKERHVCDVLKKCDQESSSSKMMTMEGWCPSDSLEELKQTLHAAVRATQAKQAALQIFDHAPHHASPPTYFKTNKFTASYQGIVDTYGVPRYKEVNPGLFTIISFPFLFGIMYGVRSQTKTKETHSTLYARHDAAPAVFVCSHFSSLSRSLSAFFLSSVQDIGHGSLLFLFSLFLLWNEQKFLDLERRGQLGEIPSMVFGGRYLLVMMGAFALYAGTIYNDLFSCPVNALGSHWDLPAIVNGTDTASVANFRGQPYPYGVDPAWYHTTNELAFFNSMKMKLAVTLGVSQMIFGICLGALNDLYFKDRLAIFFEFIPRLIFILATFGYMVFIILLKACKDWNFPGASPPLLIQTMINMFLSPGSVPSEDELYAGQSVIQAVLLLAAVFSVPVMLFPIPCITNCRNKAYLRKHGLGGLGNRKPEDLVDPEKDIQMEGQIETQTKKKKKKTTHKGSKQNAHSFFAFFRAVCCMNRRVVPPLRLARTHGCLVNVLFFVLCVLFFFSFAAFTSFREPGRCFSPLSSCSVCFFCASSSTLPTQSRHFFSRCSSRFCRWTRRRFPGPFPPVHVRQDVAEAEAANTIPLPHSCSTFPAPATAAIKRNVPLLSNQRPTSDRAHASEHSACMLEMSSCLWQDQIAS